MSKKLKKYPFFIRLKRAWAVYNEYMPSSTEAENGRQKLHRPKFVRDPETRKVHAVKVKHTLVTKKDLYK